MTTETCWTDAAGTLHEIYTGYIFVGNDLLGQLSYDAGRADLHWNRCSYALFCRHCGEIWARIIMSNSRGEQRAFDPISVACLAHRDYWNIPGSILPNHLERLLPDLPPAAVKRELEIHLNYVEKEIESCASSQQQSPCQSLNSTEQIAIAS